MDGWSSCVLARVTNCISSHCRHMHFCFLEPSVLTILFGVVPSSTSVVEEQGHEDASGSGEHQESTHSLGSQKRLISDQAHILEENRNQDGRKDRQETGLDHLSLPSSCDNLYTLGVVGLDSSFDYIGSDLPSSLKDKTFLTSIITS